MVAVGLGRVEEQQHLVDVAGHDGHILMTPD